MMIRHIFTILLMATVLSMASACGFSPMYGTYKNSEMSESLSQVKIDTIADETGIALRNALIDAFYRNGYPDAPSYRLSVEKINELITDLDITIESDATRQQIKLSTNFNLYDTKTGQVLLTRHIQSVSSYNVLGSQFTNRVSKKDARDAALNDLARQIETQIVLYLKAH